MELIIYSSELKTLKFILLEEVVLSLMMLESMSIFILDGKLAIGRGCEVVNEVENNVFASFLIGATIQNDDKKERNINAVESYLDKF